MLISADSLDYVHVHPMALDEMAGGHDMSAMAPAAKPAAVSPDMMLHVVVPKAGLYKLWVQFDGGRSLYTLPFVATAH